MAQPDVDARAIRIAELNDDFRRNLAVRGRVHITTGVSAHGREFTAKALAKVIGYDEFLTHGGDDGPDEHDTGSFELEGETVLFKIDYYDLNGRFGSEDPTDPQKTMRVATIMLASES